MYGNKDVLDIDTFTLTSSKEIQNILRNIQDLEKPIALIHIVSFLHNTILVQTLKKELQEIFKDVKIALLEHDNKSTTDITFYSFKKDIDTANKSDTIIKELYTQKKQRDVSIMEYRNKLFSRYFTDHLTNLPNTYKLRNDLEEHTDFALVVFNIDNFQTINNFYGYVVGDYVIEQVAKFLQKNIPEYKIYKLLGDEFAFIIDKDIGFYELKTYLEQLYAKINTIVIEYQDINIYVDFTLASATNITDKNIFSNVSMALKYAKEVGANFWIYEERMNFENEYERNLKFSGIVRCAVEEQKIVPYFQAIVDTKTHKVKKYECLARLLDKNARVLSPALFIPIAKRIKVYKEITKAIIDQSFAMFEESDLEFSINLSIEDIMCSEIFTYIIDKLKSSGAAKRVIFELIESDAIEDFRKVERFISEVRRYGAKIAIDDFGSGYSNFKYLAKMKPDYIKIDGSLIQDIDVDESSLLIVESIVEFARRLGIQTIAEYVHSSVILEIVKKLGVDYSQGFYIDEPSLSLV